MRRDEIFTKTYYLHRDRIYWYIRKKVSTNEIAEDIASDVFIRLLENEDILYNKDKKRVQAWLYFVARNMVIDSYRKKENNVQKISSAQDDDIFDLLAVAEDNTLYEIIAQEERDKVKEILEKLDPKDREVITLKLFDDLKFIQIAKILNEEEGSVKMRYYRAIKRIKSNK